jgi:hypothetical protein
MSAIKQFSSLASEYQKLTDAIGKTRPELRDAETAAGLARAAVGEAEADALVSGAEVPISARQNLTRTRENVDAISARLEALETRAKTTASKILDLRADIDEERAVLVGQRVPEWTRKYRKAGADLRLLLAQGVILGRAMRNSGSLVACLEGAHAPDPQNHHANILDCRSRVVSDGTGSGNQVFQDVADSDPQIAKFAREIATEIAEFQRFEQFLREYGA